MDWIKFLGWDKGKKINSPPVPPPAPPKLKTAENQKRKKPPFQYAKQLSEVQKRKKALEQELAELIVAEQQLLKIKGGAK